MAIRSDLIAIAAALSAPFGAAPAAAQPATAAPASPQPQPGAASADEAALIARHADLVRRTGPVLELRTDRGGKGWKAAIARPCPTAAWSIRSTGSGRLSACSASG
ncbi:hypothetical protein GVO57_03270 [Sphingomonas changnyeongensis]|uniref:Uncharacterized protein n=1 Tax=Sphingomonas changnyeongensis TaxID=2698679 RepID=A0A7Z2S7V5_9SPHN|nr:hypothetical protein [Sphingomonas changnyeongensis]QHL90027.1 hypothetical protein GVO57_03270 [Sphingomonas changnyeongensis]